MRFKTCSKCGASKPITEFYTYNEKPTAKCKECLREYQRKYEPKEKRHQRYKRDYIKDSLKTGMRYRVGLKYILNMPTETHAKCTKCGQWKTLEHYRKEKTRPGHHPNYYRTTCKECDAATGKKYYAKHYVPVPPRPQKTEEEKGEALQINRVLVGDGCCLYCGETDFWKLNNHHPWKKRDPNFTVTLCENHHAFCTRKLPFLLEEWC